MNVSHIKYYSAKKLLTTPVRYALHTVKIYVFHTEIQS